MPEEARVVVEATADGAIVLRQVAVWVHDMASRKSATISSMTTTDGGRT
jgi:hypothetical protein